MQCVHSNDSATTKLFEWSGSDRVLTNSSTNPSGNMQESDINIQLSDNDWVDNDDHFIIRDRTVSREDSAAQRPVTTT